MWIWLGVIIAVALIALLVMWAFNGAVRRRNRTAEAWSQIEVELERRHDLVPNLVETVRGYAQHERGTFDAVTQARAQAVRAGASRDPQAVSAAEGQLTSTLRSLFAVAEAYPQLRASENFRVLQEQLTATEDKIEYARRYYNTSARDYNTAIQTFPRNLIAGPFGFAPLGYFHTPETDQVAPRVDFGSSSSAGA